MENGESLLEILLDAIIPRLYESLFYRFFFLLPPGNGSNELSKKYRLSR